MMTTQVYSSQSSSSFESSNNCVTLSAVSIPTQPPMNIFEPYYTCCRFIFDGSLGAPTLFPAYVTMIFDIAP